MSFINVYQDERGLWTASLCRGNKELVNNKEVENIGGSYPKANSAKLDAQYKWGRDFEVKVSWGPMFISDNIKKDIIKLLDEGIESSVIASRYNGIKPEQVRAIKAHLTMGTYNF